MSEAAISFSVVRELPFAAARTRRSYERALDHFAELLAAG